MKRRKSKKKLKVMLFFILLIVIVVICCVMFYINKNKNDVVVSLKDNRTILLGEEIYVSNMIDDINYGKLKEDVKIDTSRIGKQDIKIKIISDDEKVVDYVVDVNIIDNIAPVIEADDIITIYVNDEVNLLDSSYVTVKDNYDGEVHVTILGEYDNTKEGEYKLKYVSTDESNNKSEKEFTLVVAKPKYKKMPDKTITTSKGYTLTIKNGVAYVEGILIANKTYYLPENYVVEDSYNSNITGSCPTCLNKTVMEAFNLMKADAGSLGMSLWIASGYRSYSTQKTLYNNYVNRDGKKEADTYSARAGYSEHQTGLCFDTNSVDSSFAYTKEGKWLNNNSYLYGFIIRYPKGKEDITGYMYEPWHLRYVGKDLANKLYNDGDWITLEEYFGITSKYED